MNKNTRPVPTGKRRRRRRIVTPAPACPNPPDSLYFSRKAQELLGSILCGAGTCAMMLLFLALS